MCVPTYPQLTSLSRILFVYMYNNILYIYITYIYIYTHLYVLSLWALWPGSLGFGENTLPDIGHPNPLTFSLGVPPPPPPPVPKAPLKALVFRFSFENFFQNSRMLHFPWLRTIKIELSFTRELISRKILIL